MVLFVFGFCFITVMENQFDLKTVPELSLLLIIIGDHQRKLMLVAEYGKHSYLKIIISSTFFHFQRKLVIRTYCSVFPRCQMYIG